MANAASNWAWDEFGRAPVRDLRCKKRLLRMAMDALQHPSGRVSESIRCPRALAGAYDLLESAGVTSNALLESIAQATVRRCRTHNNIIVPVDGSSLSLQGKVRGQAFGALGAHRQGGRGVKVMTALAVATDGTPMGLCSQQWWLRSQRSKLPDSKKRPLSEKESRFWIHAIGQTREVFQTGSRSRPWFQLDREGDNLSIISESIARGDLITVRSRHNRRLRTSGEPLKRWLSAGAPLLHSQLDKQPTLGTMLTIVRSRETGQQRIARVGLRAARVMLDHVDHRTSRQLKPVEVVAVQAREIDSTDNTHRINWILLTTAPAESFEEAKYVVKMYCLRWRIEDFHRTWKRGHCRVEETQLRSANAVKVWATILAAVATRIERLRHLSRTAGDELATAEFEKDELESILLLKRNRMKRKAKLPQLSQMTIAEATMLVAELGGHVRTAKSPPPGATTIGRGLEWVQIATEVLRATRAGPT